MSRALRILSFVWFLGLAQSAAAVIIVDSPFPASGYGGAVHGQSITVGAGGVVREIDAFVNIQGQDLNGAAFGTAAQFSFDVLPPGLTLGFNAALSADGSDLFLDYRFSNGAGAPLVGFSFAVFVDADIDASTNSFFNEFASTVGTLSPGQTFEIDEPGFSFGDIIDNALAGTLDGSNALANAGILEDVSVALSHTLLAPLAPGEEVAFRVMLSEDEDHVGSFAVVQGDSVSSGTVTFSSTLLATRELSEPPVLALLGVGLGLLALRVRR